MLQGWSTCRSKPRSSNDSWPAAICIRGSHASNATSAVLTISSSIPARPACPPLRLGNQLRRGDSGTILDGPILKNAMEFPIFWAMSFTTY